MTAKYVAYRAIATASAILVVAAPAFAETSLSFKTVSGTESAPVSAVNFSISRVYDYDTETGMQVTAVPPRVELGSVFITRTMDSASAAFVGSVAKGEPLGDVTISFDNGDTWLLKKASIMNYNSYSEESGSQTENFDLFFDAGDLKIGDETITIERIKSE